MRKSVIDYMLFSCRGVRKSVIDYMMCCDGRGLGKWCEEVCKRLHVV